MSQLNEIKQKVKRWENLPDFINEMDDIYYLIEQAEYADNERTQELEDSLEHYDAICCKYRMKIIKLQEHIKELEKQLASFYSTDGTHWLRLEE